MSILKIVWALWFFTEVLLLSQRGAKIKTQEDKEARNVLIVGILFAISVSILTAFNFSLPISKSNIVPYSGVLLIIAGLMVRVISIFSLGKNFSLAISVQQGQTLKTNGLYAVVRHPAYLGLLIAFLGFGFTLNNILSVATAVIPVWLVVKHRIRVEEQKLVEYFGEKYENYRKHTKMLIPWIL